jgi:hypothetical protein
MYCQFFTTFCVLFFTLFLLGVTLTWNSQLSGLEESDLKFKDPYITDHVKRNIHSAVMAYHSDSLVGINFYINCGVGGITSLLGVLTGFLLYSDRGQPWIGLTWFVTVSLFSLAWMVTSIIFVTDLKEVAEEFETKAPIGAPLLTIFNWGEKRYIATMIGMTVAPTVLFIFCSFVAYRLWGKLQVYQGIDPDTVEKRDVNPGSWFDRPIVEAGTWQVEEEPEPVVIINELEIDDQEIPLVHTPDGSGGTADGLRNRRASVVAMQQEVGGKQRDSLTGGWGTWLEDIFDYTTF